MKRLLIVVDYQNDFVDGALGFEGAEKLEEYIAQKIEEYRKSGDEVAFTYDKHQRNYLETLEGKNLPIEHCIEGTPGFELFGSINDLVGDCDPVFTKGTFGSIDLTQFLARRQHAADELGVQPFISIELVGLVSHICILSNAVLAKAACPNVPIIVDALGTDSYDKELQAKAFDVLEGIHIQVENR